MNCQDFTTQVGEFAGLQKSELADRDELLEHASICPRCDLRLETETSLTAGLVMLATDEQKIEAPSFLRNDLLIAFNNHVGAATPNVVTFPSRSNWTRWALAAAATILLGFLLFTALWALEPNTNGTSSAVATDVNVKPTDTRPDSSPAGPSKSTSVVSQPIGPEKTIARSTVSARRVRQSSYSKPDAMTTEVASTEVKSEFVPLTYLNDATAMESGIVVRVEIAREQLAALGLPFDLERADEIIKADIVLGDDGVARAIRLVQ